MRYFSVLAIVCCMAAACDDAGQSGSEVMKPPMDAPAPGEQTPGQPPRLPPEPHCPCDGLRQMQPIRAKIVDAVAFPAISAVRYELVAEQLLGPDPLGLNELAVGDHFGGYWNGQLACGGTIELAVGAEVLAFHRRGRQDGLECCDYIACSDRCRALPGADQDQSPTSAYGQCESACETTTHDACAQHRREALLHGELMLTPWSEMPQVGDNLNIRLDQLDALQLDREACVSALPNLRPPPAASETSVEQTPIQSVTVAPPPAPGTTPLMPPPPPPPSAAAPPLPTGLNVAQVANGPPPAGPEEIRVRCTGQ
jgi:hypothetical protein